MTNFLVLIFQVATSTVCSHCKMIIDSEDQFYQHLQKHCSPVNMNGGQVTFPTSCIICRQTLVSDIEVKVHVHYHLSRLKEPPTVCGNCNRYKSSPSSPCTGCNPNRNTTERCPDCNTTFETFGSLQHHLTTVHRKPFQCFKCKVENLSVLENQNLLNIKLYSFKITYYLFDNIFILVIKYLRKTR